MGTVIQLDNVLIEGGTVYPFEEIAALFTPLIGKEVTLGHLMAITNRITKRYQDDGYALSYAVIPAQDLNYGQVRLILVEGYIADHEMRGDVGPVEDHIGKLAAKLINERPLRKESFERYTTLMAQIPGVTLRANVPAPTTTDGAVTLVTEAVRKPFAMSANLSHSNRDDAKVLLAATSNSHTAVGEQVTLSTLLPPGDDDERYARIDYSQFIGDEGTRLNGYVSAYRSDPDKIYPVGVANTEMSRKNDRFSIGIAHPFKASPSETLTGGARIYAVNDERDFTRLTPLPVVPDAIKVKSKVRALALEGEWKIAEQNQLRIASGGLYQGLDALGAESDVKVLNESSGRFHDLDFLRLRLSGVQTNVFDDNWQSVLSGAFYWSEDTLPTSEQVLFGDRNFGRGYPAEQAYGDKGWGLGYELGYSLHPGQSWLRLIQPYAAADAARTWFNDDGIDSQLSSYALGMRFSDRRYYNLALEVSRPMGDKVIDSADRDPRFSFSLSYNL
ncbi:ShlB/FhaC/HecB family hemolysin secretion/activation protein [Zobellella aerophila]|uniref:POTRA domain-containing protein n=1 Tax=Zobellella aerophila TaxID=870480 RepID=A0ABP6VUQ6_9GAMM